MEGGLIDVLSLKRTVETSVVPCCAVLGLLVTPVQMAYSAEAGHHGDTSLYLAHVESVFVPQSFDDNDNAQVVLDGWLGSTCDVIVRAKVQIGATQETIEITSLARRGRDLCLPLASRFTQVVDLGILPFGDYQVITNGWVGDTMPVIEAGSAGPDDEIYAIVDGVILDHAPDETESRWSVLLTGRLMDSCERLAAIEVQHTGRTYEVYPIIKHVGENCVEVIQVFNARTFLPEPDDEGRHLARIRSRGGAKHLVFSIGH